MILSNKALPRVVAHADMDAFYLIDHSGSFRLIGMFAYDPVGIDDSVQVDLFSGGPQQRRLEAAIDALADRFGANVVHRANDLTNSPSNTASTLDFLDD
jgi:hypothetical protein